MRYIIFIILLISMFLTTFVTASPKSVNWDPIRLQSDALGASKLHESLSLDGDLAEWDEIPSVCAKQISAAGSTIDAAFQFYTAWTDEGICLAVNVTDDEMVSPAGQDIICLLVDSRSKEARAKGDYNEEEYQIHLFPPINGRKAEIICGPAVSRMTEMKTAAKMRADGFSMEALIPWGVVPALPDKTGGECRIQCLYFDYDPHDPTTSAFYLTRGPWWPRAYTDYRLIDRPVFGKDVSFRPAVDITAPVVMYPYTSAPIVVNICPGVSDMVESVKFTVRDKDGKEIATGSAKSEHQSGLPPGWASATLGWIPKNINDGYVVADAQLIGKDGQVIGHTQEQITVISGIMVRALSDMKDADLPKLSQTEPFRAAAYLGVAACQERLKQAAQEGRLPDIKLTYGELNARLDVLAGGTDRSRYSGVFDLLRLSSIPDSQVTVEFPEENKATIAFNFGAVPLVRAEVTQYPTNSDAEKGLIPEQSRHIYKDKYVHTRLGLYDAFVAPTRAISTRMATDDFDPGRHVLLYLKDGATEALPVELLSGVKVDAVTILPSCPQEMKEKVTAWAKSSKTPVTDYQTASSKDRFMIAGSIKDSDASKIIAQVPLSIVVPDAGCVDLNVRDGNRVVRVQSRSRKAAELAAKLILADKPISPADIDALRSALVESRPQRIAQSESVSGLNLYTGDVHSHTIYSDGSPTPAGLGLEAMYCNLDYLVITDHNAVQGAHLAQNLFNRSGLTYPIIVGEEVEVSYFAEFNAYPVDKLIPAGLEPDECIKIAHESGAVVHWNHPGYPDWRNDWAQTCLKSGINASGLDAWEHYPYHYQDWKQTSSLPAIMGSSDSHDARFNMEERTIILAPSANGESLADAVRKRNTLMVHPYGKELFYGPDWLISIAWDAMEDGKKLKDQKAEQIKATLRSANIPALIRSSSPKME